MADSLNLLKDYSPIEDVAASLGVNTRTIRRRIHAVDGWPSLRWGNRLWLHVPTVRKILEADTRSLNPTRTPRKRQAV